MENDEQALLHGFMEEGGDYELGDVSEEEEDEEDVHLPAENQDAGTQEGDLDQSGVDAEEALPRAHTKQFSTPVTESFAVSQQLTASYHYQDTLTPLRFSRFYYLTRKRGGRIADPQGNRGKTLAGKD